MQWEVDAKAAKRLADIARAVKGADKVILATDPDREGEAISWHVLEVLRARSVLKDKPVERVVFNAITKGAVREAMQHPREIDQPLVDAYLARRALDYLVGFNLSPVLWRKLPGLPLGRPRPVGGAAARLRPRARDREVPAARILVDRRPPADRRTAAPSRPGSSARTARRSHGSTSAPARRPRRSGGAGERALHGRVASRPSRPSATPTRPSAPRRCSRRPRASSASPRPAPCSRPAALRGRRHRRRDGRPHHLHANRRRRHGARGHRRRAPRHRQGIRRATTCRRCRANTR